MSACCVEVQVFEQTVRSVRFERGRTGSEKAAHSGGQSGTDYSSGEGERPVEIVGAP